MFFPYPDALPEWNRAMVAQFAESALALAHVPIFLGRRQLATHKKPC